MTRGNLIKAARIGYLEAQQRLDWDLGDRVHYYDATSSFYDEYSNIIPVDIDIDGFYYENKIEINDDSVFSGIVIPKVDTTIDPARNTPMIDRESGMRYELTIDPAWTAEQCENKVSGFICDAYTEHVGGAMNYTHQGAEYNKIHDAVMSGIIEGRADESGENRYNIYDFAAKDLGGKLQYTWELRIGTENHNMCVEYDKKTDTTRIVAERMDAEDNLIRKFSMGTFDTEELHTQLEFVLGDIVMEHNAKQHAEAAELLEALGIDMNELEM